MGESQTADTVVEKNLAGLFGLLAVSVGLVALIYGSYVAIADGSLVVLLVGSTLLGGLGAGYLYHDEVSGTVE